MITLSTRLRDKAVASGWIKFPEKQLTDQDIQRLLNSDTMRRHRAKKKNAP